jgi:chemotaxis response regulator CheB
LRLWLVLTTLGRSSVVNDNENQGTQPPDRAADAAGERNGSERMPVIVAIGASAGGIHALQSFFAALPHDTGAAFVVVVHLDPQHRSEMPAIIATRTKMPVMQIGDHTRLQANHV